MKPIKLFCLLLALIFITAGCKKKLPEPTKSLHQAAADGDIQQVQLHISRRTDVNAKDNLGWTPLHRAAYRGHKYVVELLLANGVDVNAKDDNGMTALHLAAAAGHKDVAELLIEYLLRSVRTLDDKIMMFSIVHRFGPYAVVPILKQYENPNSSKEQKDLAGILILNLPDTEPVIDKVVEAYKHGRYFKTQRKKPDKDGKIRLSFKELFEETLSWWGNVIKSKYRGNESFVKYVAEKHLPNPDEQEAVIELLASTDFSTAAKYFESLDYNTLSDKALDMLILTVGIPPTETAEKDSCLTERFSLFCKIFADLAKSKREEKKLLSNIRRFPNTSQQLFIVSNFKDFIEEEKDYALYVCSKLGPTARKRTYDSIRSYCSPEQIMMIEHYEKK